MPKMYPVSKVLDCRVVQGRKEYLVRWKGYAKKYDSWVGEKDVNSAVKKAYDNNNQGR